MNTSSIKIRRANFIDAQRIFELCPQLGYEPSLDDIQYRLQKILQSNEHEVLVATDETGKVRI